MPVVLSWSLSNPEGPPEGALGRAATGAASGDIELWWSAAALAADVSVELNDLARDHGLRTAVMLSLFCDRQSDAGDVLPDAETDRRGWWGDAVAEVEGDKIGSRLWLLARSKSTQSVLSRVEEYASEALRWLVDDKVAERVVVVGSIPRAGLLGMTVDVYRPKSKQPTRFRFESAWRSEETR